MELAQLLKREGEDGVAVLVWANERAGQLVAQIDLDSELGALLGGTPSRAVPVGSPVGTAFAEEGPVVATPEDEIDLEELEELDDEDLELVDELVETDAVPSVDDSLLGDHHSEEIALEDDMVTAVHRAIDDDLLDDGDDDPDLLGNSTRERGR